MKMCYLDNHICEKDSDDESCVDCELSDAILHDKLKKKDIKETLVIKNKNNKSEPIFLRKFYN